MFSGVLYNIIVQTLYDDRGDRPVFVNNIIIHKIMFVGLNLYLLHILS